MSYVRLGAAILIMLVWAAVYVAAILDPSRNAPGEVTAVALVASTYLLGSEAAAQMRRRKNGD